MSRLEKAFKLFDDYNKQDPNILSWNGLQFPAEYFYALQLHEWVKKLEPAAGEALLLASRSQHIGRWQIPRENYPMNKAGYLTWRMTLAKFHADTAASLMKEAGYEEELIAEVQHIILKKNLKSDHAVQVMENALCLVFLEFQYHDFIINHDDDKVIRIIQKSWRKMTEPGRAAALKLHFDARGKSLIVQALGEGR
jgi:hypothetical protein